MKFINLFLCLSFIAFPVLAQSKKDTTVKFCSVEEQYFIRTIKWETINSINSKPGDLTIAAFAVSNQIDGPQIGLIVSRQIDLGLNGITPGPNSMREASITSFLPGGTLVSVQVTDFDSEKMADLTRAIVGGTGKYFGASGSVRSERVKVEAPPTWKTTFKLILPCNR